MSSEQKAELTRMLRAWGKGDDGAEHAIVPLIYPELERRAQIILRRNSGQGESIQTHTLVHEAFLKLADKGFDIKDRLHFFAMSSTILRRILIDYVRELHAQKRGGGAVHLTLGTAERENLINDAEQLLELNDLLDKLKEVYPRKARICEMHYFSGLKISELAELENVSTATVNNDLRFARAWMRSMTDA